MTARISITSASNDRLKTARRLLHGRRRGGQTFLAEGHRQLRCALEAGAVVREVFAAPELFLGPTDADLVEIAERRGARVYEVGRSAFRAISRQARPDGLVAVVERWPTALEGLRVPREPLLFVAEAIERPGNLGTIVRTTCAAGADALVVADPVTSVFHPETVRGSAGTLFAARVATATTAAAITWLRDAGVAIVVASPSGCRPHWDADCAAGVAFVVGNERHGVTGAWLDAADEVVAIPMPGPADSLNVAVAAGIVLFDATRRRMTESRDETGTQSCA
jgi:TrmH family RNA methyltransferase